MSIEKQAKIWFKPKFRCIFDKSEISTVSCKRCYEITPCRCQDGSHLTGLFRIDSKGWKRLSNFISALLAIEEKRKHENAFVLVHFTCQHTFHQRTLKTSVPNSLFQNEQNLSSSFLYKCKVEQFGERSAEIEVRRQNVKIKGSRLNLKKSQLCFRVGRCAQIGNLVFGSGLECKR